MGSPLGNFSVFRPSELATPRALAAALQRGALLSQSRAVQQMAALAVALEETDQGGSDLAEVVDFYATANSIEAKQQFLALLVGMLQKSSYQDSALRALEFLQRRMGENRFAPAEEVVLDLEQTLERRRHLTVVVSDGEGRGLQMSAGKEGAAPAPVQKSRVMWTLVNDRWDEMVNLAEIRSATNPPPIALFFIDSRKHELRLKKGEGEGSILVLVDETVVGRLRITSKLEDKTIRIFGLPRIQNFGPRGKMVIGKTDIIEALKAWRTTYNQNQAERRTREMLEERRHALLTSAKPKN